MKKTEFDKLLDRVILVKLKAVDRVINELVEPLADIGNPEKLIGKNYSAWTPEDLQRLTQIYGTGENSPLANTIFRREFERVKQLESEVK